MTTTSELRSQIESKSEEVSKIAQKIENRIEEYVDWKGIVQERPLASVGVALGVGLVLSGAAGPLVKFFGKQAATIAKGSATAYLLNMVQNNMKTSSTSV